MGSSPIIPIEFLARRKANRKLHHLSLVNTGLDLKTNIYICFIPLVPVSWLKCKLEKTVWHIPFGLFELTCSGYIHLVTVQEVKRQAGSETSHDKRDEQRAPGSFGFHGSPGWFFTALGARQGIWIPKPNVRCPGTEKTGRLHCLLVLVGPGRNLVKPAFGNLVQKCFWARSSTTKSARSPFWISKDTLFPYRIWVVCIQRYSPWCSTSKL